MNLDDSTIIKIRETMNPEEVFTDEQLIAWANRCKTPDEVFPYQNLKAGIEEIKTEWRR